jgi:hypothetical protein
VASGPTPDDHGLAFTVVAACVPRVARTRCHATINIAHKTPDALVFVTDGLASISDVDPTTGDERITSSMAHVEKLASLSDGRVLAMWNGVGSLRNGSIATELRRFDTKDATADGEELLAYARRVDATLVGLAQRYSGSLPRSFQLVLGSMPAHAPPPLVEIRWPIDGSDSVRPVPCRSAAPPRPSPASS